MKKIIITSDIDWALDEVIDDFLSILKSYQVSATLFCTHESEVVKGMNSNQFETAIHPNFNPSIIQGEPFKAEKIIDDLMMLYPDAIGVRSHSMTSSTILNNLFNSKGLKYESNIFIPYKWEVKPFKSWTGLTSIPYHWEDDVHFSYLNEFKPDFDSIFDKSDQFIFDFHPIHVFLNTDVESTYIKAKKDYHNLKNLYKYQNSKSLGVRDYLISMLEYTKNKEFKFCKMKDLVI